MLSILSTTRTAHHTEIHAAHGTYTQWLDINFVCAQIIS